MRLLALAADKYTTRPMASSDIYYKDGSHPYGVSVSTDFTQLYEPITPSTSDDTTAVNADVERLLAQYDMTAVDSPKPPSKSISYKSFANTTIICQNSHNHTRSRIRLTPTAPTKLCRQNRYF